MRILLLACLFIGCAILACGEPTESTTIDEPTDEEITASPPDRSNLPEPPTPPEEPMATPDDIQLRRGAPRVRVGAENLLRDRMALVRGRRVGVVANHTSLLYRGGEGGHLVDELLEAEVEIVRVFSPEHGFRGDADAGARVASSTDPATGLPIVSLYGNNKKPKADQLSDLDIILFDLQDVGCRFYTYISTLSYVMEACAETGVPIVVLDRPNPNGWYVDGPVLEAENESFIGLHPIPIVHGCTMGEYAEMVNGEGWLAGGARAQLEVVPASGYRHDMHWDETGLPWIAPSPNLATEYAAYLYPALCWFEPTPVSVGRGTNDAFTILGAPWFGSGELTQARLAGREVEAYGLTLSAHSFMPVSMPGKATSPKFQNERCHGMRFSGRTDGRSLFLTGLYLLQRFYDVHDSARPGERFFKKGFARWPGYAGLETQIKAGVSPEEIYQSWQEDVETFRAMREKYLMY